MTDNAMSEDKIELATADISQHPLPEPRGAWYWGEEDLHGPFGSREEANEDAAEHYEMESYDAAAFYVHKRVNLASMFNAEEWLNRISERLSDTDMGGDEYGDHDPIGQIDMVAGDDLQISVRRAIWDWQRRHQLQLTSYWMDEIPAPDEADHG